MHNDHAYSPPRADAEPPRQVGAASYGPAIRRLLLVVAAAVVVHAYGTAGLLHELDDPGPTLDVAAYTYDLRLHAFGVLSIVLPLALGMLPVLGTSSPRPIASARVIDLASLSWGIGSIGTVVGLTVGSSLVATLAVHALVLGSLVLGGGLLWALLDGGRDSAQAAPMSFVGALATAAATVCVMGWVLAAMHGVVPADRDPLPLALVGVVPLVLVVGFEQVAPARRIAGLATLVLVSAPLFWFALSPPPSGLGSGSMASVVGLGALVTLGAALVSSIRAALAWARDRERLSAGSLAASLGVQAVCVASMAASFLVSLSVDVHLYVTYFALGPTHLISVAVVMIAVALGCRAAPTSFARVPRPRLASLGVLLLGGGLVGVVVLLFVLGQQGMPRHYHAYPPQFEMLHDGLRGVASVGATGLIVVLLAVAFGSKPEPRSASPHGVGDS